MLYVLNQFSSGGKAKHVHPLPFNERQRTDNSVIKYALPRFLCELGNNSNWILNLCSLGSACCLVSKTLEEVPYGLVKLHKCTCIERGKMAQ